MRAFLPALLALSACTEPESNTQKSLAGRDPGDTGSAGDTATGDTAGDSDTSTTDPGPDDTGSNPVEGELLPPGSCGFDYAERFGSAAPPPASAAARGPHRIDLSAPGTLAYADPLPERTRRAKSRSGDIDMPGYSDTMPLFDRAYGWAGERCFELPEGAVWLTEEEAFDLYRNIAEETTGVPMIVDYGVRTVVGVRGAFPGTFTWNGNTPNTFDDTLVLLWRDADGKHVIELPVNTDTGAYDFGTDSSSSLRANRRYHHEGGKHRGSYDALTMGEWGYHSIDDSNANGHLDSDRNGWLPPQDGEDYERVGSGHNIHVASVDGPLEDARIDNWSAGCHTIPGMANWEAFIEEAWPGSGEPVNYFLVDARDIDPVAFKGPCTPDGTSACPFPIDSLPFSDRRSTVSAPQAEYDTYNCSGANEGGGEFAYLLRVDDTVSLAVSVVSDAGADVDVHLLDAADPDACLARDDTDLSYDLQPGRYYVIADTYVSDGTALSGAFTLTVESR